MYVALGLALIVAFLGHTYRKWAEALVDVPLNYIAEPRYQTGYRNTVPAPIGFPVFATSASSASYVLPMAVVDPRQVVEYERNLERIAFLPGIES